MTNMHFEKKICSFLCNMQQEWCLKANVIFKSSPKVLFHPHPPRAQFVFSRLTYNFLFSSNSSHPFQTIHHDTTRVPFKHQLKMLLMKFLFFHRTFSRLWFSFVIFFLARANRYASEKVSNYELLMRRSHA